MCESPTPGDIQNKPLTNLYLLFFLLTMYSFCKIIFLSLKKPRFRTYNASKDVIGAFHNVLLMKTPVSLSNALLSKATRWQKLHSYWLAKATRCFLKQRVVATRNDPFGLPYRWGPAKKRKLLCCPQVEFLNIWVGRSVVFFKLSFL